LGLAGWVGGAQMDDLNAYVSGLTALVLTAAVIVGCLIGANRRLRELEVRETS
jgi:hypothetical protein